MKKAYGVLFLFVSIAVWAQTQDDQQRVKRAPIRELTLSGSGYELGLQHGTVLKKEIAEIVTKWKTNTSRYPGRNPEDVLSKFIAYAQFNDAIKKWTPELYEEIRGIAKGSGQAFNDIMALNLLDEFWVYQDNDKHHHCSVVGVPAVDGNAGYIAQNIDVESYIDGFQILVRLKGNQQRPGQLIITHPGLIALGGMNQEGIGACMNSLMQLKASPKGLPVAFIVRRIINSTDKVDILRFLREVPHASGQNYMIGIKGEIYDFEASATKVVMYDPGNKNGVIAHTNHPLLNDDVKEWYKNFNPAEKDAIDPLRSNSHIRLKAVENRVNSGNAVTVTLTKKALRSKDDLNNPVCRSLSQGGLTFSSVVMTLTEKPFLEITAGPPDESEYKKVKFDP